MSQSTLRQSAWVAIAALSVVTAPWAILAMWHMVWPSAPYPTDILLSHGVSREFLHGRDASAVSTASAYQKSLVPMFVHTVAGGLLVLLGPTQFSSRLRLGRPRLHRMLGKAYLTIAVAMTLGAMVYLARTPGHEVLSGGVFALQLWVLGFGTLLTAGLAIAAIRTGDVMVHLRFMALNFGLILATPIQRIDWVVIGNLDSRTNHVEANLATLMHLGPLVILGAVVAGRALDRRTTVSGVVGPIIRPEYVRLLQGAGLGSLVAFIVLTAGLGRVATLGLVSFVGPLLVFWAAIAIVEHRSRRRGADLAASEWGAHLAAIAIAPTLTLGLYLFFRMVETDTMALYTAVVLAWPACQFTAATVVAARLYRARSRLVSSSRSRSSRPVTLVGS